MNALVAIAKRAAGFAPLPEPLIEVECRREIEKVLTVSFPALSRIEKECRSVENKRIRLNEDLEIIRAERSRLVAEIVDLDADEADIIRILAGLDKHEAEINGNPCSNPAPATPAKRKGRG